MPYTIRVDVSQVTQLLSRVSQALTSDVPQKALTAGANALVSSATATVPVRTGHLRSSISAGQASAEEVEVVAEAEYAAFVELGTSRMSAQPYMKPGIPQATQALVNTALQEIKNVIG